jgi:hypothetical protein
VTLAPEIQLDDFTCLGIVLHQEDPPPVHAPDASAGS